MDTQTLYQRTIKFAALKHLENGQTIPGTNIPYVVHLSNVAMEVLVASEHSTNFDINFAIQIALLHDTLEDTSTTIEDLTHEFGIEVSNAVLALTKNSNLSKEEKMIDSLTRVKACKKEVWAVKLADRVTNLQEPPLLWNNLKKQEYLREAGIILKELEGCNYYLESRLKEKIGEYNKYVSQALA